MTAVCGFLGCENEIPGDYPWQMCEPCADHAWAVEDSNYAECTCGHYYDTEHGAMGVCLVTGCGCGL